MNLFKKFMSYKLILNYKLTFLFLTIYSVALTMLMLWIQPISLFDILNILSKSNYLAFILNLIPILMLNLIFLFITNNITITISLVGFLIMLISVINRFKILLRQDPFKPWDIILGTETITVTTGFNLKTMALCLIGILIFIGIIILLNFKIKNKKINFKLRIPLIIITFISILILNNSIFKNYKIYSSLHVLGNVYNNVAISNSKGFLYNFIYIFNTNKINKPNTYNKSEVENLVKNLETTKELHKSDKPHVIVIMLEAFSDISISPHLDFSNYNDPLKHFKEIQKESITGKIIVPNVGGGTADTEFDFLTAINTRQFRGVAYSYALVTKPFKNITNIFNNLGYDNIAIHPGFDWFYNRLNVFRYFGFNKFININNFDENTFKGYYVSDEANFDTIIETFDNHVKNNSTPFFLFNVTIQNHGPYEDKYLSDINFDSNLELDEADINTLSNYFEGVSDQDRELKRLVDYLDAINEPVLLVFFGDHLPALSENAYNQLIPDANAEIGSFESMTRMYKIPFTIWQNANYKNINDLAEFKLDNNIISSFYLGALTLEILGFSALDPYYEFLNKLRLDYPVILENNYFDKNNNFYETLNNSSTIEKLINWQYYRSFDE